jgi:outer membrane protein TolC
MSDDRRVGLRQGSCGCNEPRLCVRDQRKFPLPVPRRLVNMPAAVDSFALLRTGSLASREERVAQTSCFPKPVAFYRRFTKEPYGRKCSTLEQVRGPDGHFHAVSRAYGPNGRSLEKRDSHRYLSCLLALSTFFLAIPMRAGAQAQGFFQGSVPTGQATRTTLPLSLSDTFTRALRYNLGGIEGEEDTRAARATRLRNLNALLPNLEARVSSTIQQIDLRALGISINIPGVHIPTIVGPFGVADARAYFSQEIFNWSNIKNLKSSSQSERASQYTYRSDRDLVVYTTGSAYLTVIADGANVDSIRAQVKTAQTLYQQDVDQNRHGVIASIDVLRAHVELETQQQRLIAGQNQLEIDKLALARVIGLPNGQQFRLTDTVPYRPLAGISQEQALSEAYSTRPDYLSDKAQVRAAELALQAAAAENYPFLSTSTDFGDIGSPNFGTSHETFDFGLTLNIPVFQGTRVRADKLQAVSTLRRRRAELADLGGKIDDQVRTAFFNLKSSSELVRVAESNTNLANQTLAQARDRFKAGVADNLEVVQAQESVAAADQSYISILYSFNVAKLSLAQAIGVAETSGLHYLGVR